MGKLFRSQLNCQIFKNIEKQWRFSSKGPLVEKLRLAQQRRRITLWAPTIEVYMLYESLPDTKPNKENGPWPLLGALVERIGDLRNHISHENVTRPLFFNILIAAVSVCTNSKKLKPSVTVFLFYYTINKSIYFSSIKFNPDFSVLPAQNVN